MAQATSSAAAAAATAPKRVAIVGGGLVGALNAVYFARRGCNVDVYEARDDIRQSKTYSGRSINLALSTRGIQALKDVGLDEMVVATGIPMYGRMIHNPTGGKYVVPYGKDNQAILSVDRRKLNELLLTTAEKLPNVSLHFEHKLTEVDVKARNLTLRAPDRSTITVKPDLVVGSDGAYSSVRRHLLQQPRFNYAQTYIAHGYKELTIPPVDGKFAMEANYLHIWPRHEFMMIALPNQDRSFTCTLFMPFDIFATISTPELVLAFFRENFADAIPLIGQERLVSDFFTNPTSTLMMVKCSPYHIDDFAVIIGDAAHAMVPFYGQGMNCGFEDCTVLHRLLGEHNMDLATALPAYSKERNPDAEAICDLALHNYVEMRHHVTSTSFLLRKKLDSLLHSLMPNTFIPLYTMVTFSRIPYAEVIERQKWQDRVVSRAGYLLLGASVLGAALLAKQRLTK
ncbi:kynurenine 3-monooxygenase [Capsaspora owczarzaki ATCC 30864]|uniref:Kynurenine 3-monooxygenase n=1 Tax=Capsaspora owczarzaki (strain ATCC 30864) TaxID=595528 RepID=A0A0D2UCR2_CAPO3|nr:kynurenine 3-monooxygenase [Capsaspora owczarzaki ATCC 30864]KJE92841.1 kynurenine 3-monooxygenase, variant [Capsaspora owczarzaki ATCC 30864]|eukprot:XP_004363465.2 kynurenine 3-monooxygenase [Capsaspora owczarzaki ATCC 30864]